MPHLLASGIVGKTILWEMEGRKEWWLLPFPAGERLSLIFNAVPGPC
jgi:hypothetical protein